MMSARLESWSASKPFYRRVKKKWVFAGVAVLMVGAAAPFAMHKLNPVAPAPVTMIYTVGYGNSSQAIHASGTLQLASTADLAFSDASAKVTSINVKVGQSVKQGQVLAEEDDSAMQAALLGAKSAVAQAKASLASAQTTLAQLKSGAASPIANDKQSLLKAELALKAAQAQYQSLLSTSKNDAANQQKLLMAKSTLQDDQQAASDTSSIGIAKAQLALDEQVLSSDQANQQTLQSLYGSVTEAQIKAAYQQYQQTHSPQDQTTYSNLSQGYSSLQSATQAVARDQITIQKDQQSITAAQDALQKAQQQVAIDEQNLKLVQQQVNNTSASQAALESAQLQIQMDQIALQSAQAQLSQDEQPANATAVASAEATVTAAQANLASAQNQLQAAKDAENQTKLVAPVNGTVLQVNGQVGQPASTNSASGSAGATAAFIVIQDTDTNDMQVPIQLSATQVGQVKDGDPVTVSVPSAGSTSFTGTITQVSPMPVSTTNGNMYTAIATIKNTGGLKNGMLADVSIQTSGQSNVVTIPATAVQQVGNQNGVYVVSTPAAGSSTTGSKTNNEGAGVSIAGSSTGMGSYVGPFQDGSLSDPSKLPSDVHFQSIQIASLGTGEVQVTAGLSAGQEILVQVPSSGIPTGTTGTGN